MEQHQETTVVDFLVTQQAKELALTLLWLWLLLWHSLTPGLDTPSCREQDQKTVTQKTGTTTGRSGVPESKSRLPVGNTPAGEGGAWGLDSEP